MTDKPDSAIVPPLFKYLPSMDFLLQCSKETLHDRELAALNRAANHLRTAKLEWEEAAAQREVAGIARWLIETRDAPVALEAGDARAWELLGVDKTASLE